MDPAIATVAATAATTLVAAMTTETWEQTKRAFARLLGAGRDDEGTDAEEELEQARATVQAAREHGDSSAEDEVRENWEVRLRDLLAERREADAQIRALLAAVRSPASTVYNQNVRSGGAGAQGPGASVTVNHHHTYGSPPSRDPEEESDRT
ncbi:hypothetical protein [Streptomyces litchfieldiae]|uniref:Uncharacterized protein n=1 Tax=Streptomyces litchfieldiae TaxID=3075543 RepID=A0ABU2MKC6_9ACTN|nr:hypothetical protein [Streptomyces sp. DSM 44938]MDT0341363.1 hypothetical protein [Streptomyces sp. DSM 44938]